MIAATVSPSDFGTVSVALALVVLFTVPLDLAAGILLVSREVVTPAFVATARLVSGVIASLSTLGALLLGSVMARTGSAGQVGIALMALSPAILVNGAASVHVFMAQRALRFRLLAFSDILGLVTGGLIGILVARSGHGVASLILQYHAASLVSAVVLIVALPVTWVRMGVRRDVGDLLHTGRPMAVYQLFRFAAQSADRVVVERIAGPRAAGQYSLAGRLSLDVASAIRAGFGSYAFPRLSEDKRARRSVADTTAELSILLVVVTTAVGVVSVTLLPRFLSSVLEASWGGVSEAIPWLAAVTIVQAVLGPLGELWKSAERPKRLVGWAATLGTLVLSGTYLGARHSPQGAAIGLCAAHVLALPVAIVLSRTDLGIETRRVVLKVGRAFVFAEAVLATACLTARFLGGWTGAIVGMVAGGLGTVALSRMSGAFRRFRVPRSVQGGSLPR